MQRHLKWTLQFVIGILLARVLGLIVWEYQNYFPPNFESAFLIGMEPHFRGVYPIAFYVHLVVGPLVLANLAVMLITMSNAVPLRMRQRAIGVHQRAGRLQAMLVLLLLVPSGVIMSFYAHAGPMAGLGLFALALATGWTMFQAVRCAIGGQLKQHRMWASRCGILLVSPLLLRLATGAAIVMKLETAVFLQWNAWLSWMIPLAIFEASRTLPRFLKNLTLKVEPQ